jgi:cell division transport system ATP-binding protein
MNIIQLAGVTKKYDERHTALEDIDLKVSEGEKVVISGGNGSGKTTLINLMFGLEKPTGGDIYVAGRHVNLLTRSTMPYFRRKVGILLQDHKFIERRTIWENLEFSLRVTGKHGQEVSARVKELLVKTELAPAAEKFPRELSLGELQRFNIARAVINKPTVVLADEPMANLDEQSGKKMISLFNDLNKEKLTILIVTRKEALADMIGARHLSLEEGRLK